MRTRAERIADEGGQGPDEGPQPSGSCLYCDQPCTTGHTDGHTYWYHVPPCPAQAQSPGVDADGGASGESA